MVKDHGFPIGKACSVVEQTDCPEDHEIPGIS
jgi:hypothetical protein